MSKISEDKSFQSADQHIKERLMDHQELRRSVKHSVVEKMDFDHALEKVGAEHWYQKRAFIIFALQWFVASAILLSSSFLFPTNPEYTNCPAGMDQDQCKQWVCDLPEDQWNDHLEYGTGSKHFTAAQEYHLICNKQFYNTMIQSSPYLGSFLGFLIFPFIADNKGRIAGWVSSWGICTIGCILMAISWDFWSILIGFFLAGFGVNPAITIHYSFLNEHSIGKLREYTAIGVQVAFGMGELFMVLEVYLIENWRVVCIVMLAVPAFILNCGPLFVYESPKYLYEESKEKAFEVLNKIAKVNKKEPIHLNALESMIKETEEKTYSIADLFRYPSLRVTTYCACVIFFAIQAIYYGISFSMDSVGLNIYVNTLIIGAAELLAYATTDFCIPYLKRKITVMVGLAVGAVLSIFYLFLNGDDTATEVIQIILAAVFRFNIAFVWTVVYVFLSELYPTTVRSLALGFTSLAGTIGSFGAPYLIDLCGDYSMPVLGGIALIGVLHVFPLPETFGKPLLQQIKELEKGGQDELVVEFDEEQLEDEEDKTNQSDY